MRRALMLLSLTFVPTSVVADLVSTPNIESTYRSYVTGLDTRQYDEVADTIHTQSPLYLQTIQEFMQVLPIYDVGVSINEFHDLGTDGKDCFASIVQSYKKREGPRYQDYQMKSVVVFRPENGKWKIWAILAIDMLPLPSSQNPTLQEGDLDGTG